MVALVRGVHGLNGAVRAEVLTDRPEDRFVIGAVLFREGDDRPLTIASAEAVADGPGWRIRFREISTRDGADALRGAYLEIGRPCRRGSRPRQLLLARGHRLRRPRHRRHRARDRQGHLPDRGDRGLHRRGRAVRRASTFLRSGRSSGSSPHGAARSWSMPIRSTCARRARASPIRSGPRRRVGRHAERPRHRPTSSSRSHPWRRSRRRPPSLPSPPATAHDPRDRCPDAVPGDVRRTAGREHPGTHPGAGAGDDPCPRPARVGARPASLRGRRAVRRGSRHDPPPRAGRGRDRCPPPPGLAGDPARPGRRGLPPGACRGPRERTHLIFLCPRYEGVDERIRSLVDLELSIGDYVLTGGELPALVVIDAVIRLLPGAIEAASVADESFSAGLLEYPQYTRPAVFRGLDVPAILTSGDHGAVERWRREQAIERTRARRPDLTADD